MKCASASPVTHREAYQALFDWHLGLLEKKGLSLTPLCAPKYVWTEIRTLRETLPKRRRRRGKILLDVWDKIQSLVCSWVCFTMCVCALQCTLLCVFPVYRMELLRRDSEIFFLCASSNVSQPSQVMCRKWQVYRCSLTGIICRPCAASNCRVQLNSGGLTEEYRDTHTFTEVQKARL